MQISYGDLPGQYRDPHHSSIVLVPVPFDATSTWIKGAERGPEAILEASANMELYDIETGSQVYEKGIFTDEPLVPGRDPAVMVEAVHQRVHYWLEQAKFVVTIGGEHSISLGPVLAHHRKYPDMSVLQLDAHTDLRPEYEGSPFNHACVMSRIAEICPITQVGIRSMDISEREFLDPERVFFQENLEGMNDWMDRVIATLNGNVYLTVDLDVLDPSIMPSTGTPEPGGMEWYTLLKLLRRVSGERRIIGFDVVELCPSAHNRAPDFLAAKLIYKILSYCFN
ncbi:MAG: agmatinase [Bacteroidetes bacterium]|nr:MAG: agmatinase [Bacteroidota bacterium]